MSLDVQNFNLFGKKPASKPAQKPIVTPASSPEVIEKEIAKFDAEIETTPENVEARPINEKLEAKTTTIEIERFEEIRTTPAVETMPEMKLVNKENKIQEMTIKPIEKNSTDVPLRKFETFAKLTFRAPEEHDLELKKLEHTIMRSRKKGTVSNRERITPSTIVRALLANFLERAGDMDLSGIDNEEMLKERMEKVFKQKYSKRS